MNNMAVEISGNSNQIPDQDLEENVVKICKDSDINISPMNIEGCHRLPLGRNSTNATKQVIAKFVNRKHSEAMLQRKKDINSKNKVFVTHSLCPYYRFLWGKCKDLQRKGRISQVFCLGAVVTIRVTENSPAIKILHERDLMVYQERPPDSEWKIIMLSSVLPIVIVNFRLYVNPCRPFSQALDTLLLAPFNYFEQALSLFLGCLLVFASRLSWLLFTVSGTWSASHPCIFS